MMWRSSVSTAPIPISSFIFRATTFPRLCTGQDNASTFSSMRRRFRNCSRMGLGNARFANRNCAYATSRRIHCGRRNYLICGCRTSGSCCCQERRSELGREPALIAAIGNTEFGALFAWIPILYRGIGARLVTKAYVHDSIRKIFLTFPARLRGSVICTSP